MASYSRAALQALFASRLPDNTSSQISPADLRQSVVDDSDSAAFPEDLKPETLVAAARILALTDGANIDWDVAAGANQAAFVVIAGNRIVNKPTNIAGGMRLLLFVQQDATGSRTLTWNSDFLWPGGTAPTLTTTASRVDIFEFAVIHNGTTTKLCGSTVGLNYTAGGTIIEDP